MKIITIRFGACTADVSVSDNEAARHVLLVNAMNEAAHKFERVKREAENFWKWREEYIEARKALNEFEDKYVALAYAP